MLKVRFLALLFLPCILFCACSHDGALEVQLDVETQNPDLNPLKQEGLSMFTLQLLSGVQWLQGTDTYVSGDRQVDFGTIPVGSYSRASLGAISYFGSLIAYGEYSRRFKVGASEPARIKIPLRFPFTYVSGARELPVLHPELDLQVRVFPHLAVGTDADITTATAVSPDGQYLTVLTSNSIGTTKFWMYMTRNHQRLVELQLAKTDKVNAAIYSPDGSTLLLLSHEGNWFILVNMEMLLRAEDPQTAFHYLNLDRPLAGTFLSNSSMAILSSSPYHYNTCDNPETSWLNWYTIRNPLQTGSDITALSSQDTGGHASSVALDRNTSRLFFTLPCSGEVASIRLGENSPTIALSPLNLSPCLRPVLLLCDASTLHVACVTQADTTSPQWAPAKLLIQRYNTTPSLSPNARTLIVDYPSEPIAYKPESMPAGTSLLILQAPERVLPRSMAMSALGRRLVISAEGYYHSKNISVGSGSASLEETRSKSHSILFVDPVLNTINRRVRTSCFPVASHLDSGPQGNFSPNYCSTNMGSIETTSQFFIPSQFSVVYGTP